MLNALFYTDDQLSSRYEQGDLTFFQDLLRSVPSSVIETVISVMFKSFIGFPPVIEMLIAEVKSKKLVLYIQKYYNSLKMKLTLFFLIQILIDSFILYYLALFCCIYSSSQVSWFTGCLYSFCISLLTTMGICFGLALIRFIAIKWNYRFLYNIELYVKNLI